MKHIVHNLKKLNTLLLFLALMGVSEMGWGQTATVTLRPTHLSLASTTSESAVLMTLANYSSNDARYRLFNGSNQYNCWNEVTDTYVSSQTYSDGPQVPGSPSSSTTFWILFQRGGNNTTAASYRDRLGPSYGSNYQTIALSAATSITTPFNLTGTFTGVTGYDNTVKHVVLGFSGTTLICASSTSLTTGVFTLVCPSGTTIDKVEIRSVNNTSLANITGSWTSTTAIGNIPSAAAPSPTLTAAAGATVDAPFDVSFTDNEAWRNAITSITVGGTTLTAGYSVSAGKITFTPSASNPANLLQASGTKSIAVIATGYTNATVPQVIAAGVATKLAFTTAPSSTACPNTNLLTPPVVTAQDQYNNTAATFSGEVSLTNSGSIGMTGNQVIAGTGVATFTNLQFTTTGNVTLTANSTGLTSSSPTASIAISVGNATSPAASNGNTQSVLTWTNPASCSDEIMIIAKAGSAVIASPSGDGTAYTANLAFSSGTPYDGGFVVYKGSTSSQTVTGLTNGTTYHFTFFTRKGTSWSSGITTTATPALATSTTDHFRTRATGNWNSISTWESSADGTTNWINATLTPTSTANTITILNGHTVTVTASVTVDQVTVNSGGQITVNSSQTLTIANGADSFDMSVNGTVTNSGTITATGAVKFESGGYYNHTGNGGSMVSASWDVNSTCEITGLTSATSLTNFGSQVTSYGNLVWNCTGQSAWLNATGSFDVAGDFIINSTGGGSRGINLVTASTNRTFNIAGNLEINGSKLTLTNASGIATLNIGGNLILNNSDLTQLDFGYSSSSTAPTSGVYRSVINLQGNFSNGTSSIVKITDSQYYGKIVFAKNGIQTYTNQNTTATMNGIDHVINASSTLQLASDILLDNYNEIKVDGAIDFVTYRINGAGTDNTFDLSPGATCKIGNSSGLNYVINVGGTKTFSSGANYEFNATGTQVTGALLPATVNNLTVSGTSDLTLSNAGLLTVAGNLVIGSTAKLTIGTAQSVTVTGALSNGDASRLVIKSGATGTGSLIHNTAGVGATVERYLVGYDDENDQMFHLISSPVVAQAIREEFVTNTPTAGHDFYSFDEVTNMWINTRAAGDIWNTAFENNFAVGKGYLVAYPSDVTKNFTGVLNSAEVVLTCSNTAPPAGGNGWNLLGNPFPSAIDWNALTRNGLDDALYYYDNAEQKYRYFLSIDGDVTSLGSGSQYIPAMQGFMVHASTNGATLTIPKAAKTHNGQNIYYKSTATVPGSLSLIVATNGHEDEAFIHFNNQATTAFDGAYDAYKLRSYSGVVPNLYTKGTDGNELAINGLPELGETTVIPVYLEPATAGTYSISANLSGLPNALVYLKDSKTNTTHNLSTNPVYSFTAAPGDDASRFSLHFASVGLGETPTTQPVLAYYHDGALYVNNTEAGAEIMLFGISGQLLKQQTATSGLNTLQAGKLSAGVYVVRVQSAAGTYSSKVIVTR